MRDELRQLRSLGAAPGGGYGSTKHQCVLPTPPTPGGCTGPPMGRTGKPGACAPARSPLGLLGGVHGRPEPRDMWLNRRRRRHVTAAPAGAGGKKAPPPRAGGAL